MDSQNKMIVEHLKKYGSITNMEAILRYSITSFPRRICDLRQAGYIITDIWKDDINKFGKSVRYKIYYLESEPKYDSQG